MSSRGHGAHRRPLRRDLTAAVAIALPALVLAVVIGGSLTVFLGCVVWAAQGTRLVWPLAVPAALVLHSALRIVPRRAPLTAPSGVALASSESLIEIATAEARAAGVMEPMPVRVTLRHDIRVVPGQGRKAGALEVGLPWLVGASTADVKAGIAGALARDRDRVARALAWVREHLVARTREVGGDSFPGAMWRALAGLEERLVRRAIADREVALAADVARRHGADAAMAALRAVVRGAVFDDYWREHVSLCLTAGYRPPILDGWRRYLRAPAVAEWLAETTAEALAGPLAGRCRAIEAAGAPAGDRESAGSAEIDGDVELAILSSAASHSARELVPLAWERVGAAVLVPLAAEDLGGESVAATTVGEIVEMAADATDADRGRLGAALALTLHHAGWRLDWRPGEPAVATFGDHAILPFAVPFALDDDQDRAEWQHLVDELGLADHPLAVGAGAAHSGDEAEPAGTLADLPTRAPRGEIVLQLPGSERLRRRTCVTFAITLPFAVPCTALLGWEAAALDAPRGARIFVGAIALATAAALGGWVWSRIRLVWSTGTLTVGETRVVLEHRGLLREPWHTDARNLRAVVIDDGAATSRTAVHPRARFPFAASPWERPGSGLSAPAGWLWHDEHDVVVPLLALPRESPNLALIFDPAPAGPRPRRITVAGPQPGELLGGLLLAVSDPSAAEARLRDRGILRALTTDDVRSLHATFVGGAGRLS